MIISGLRTYDISGLRTYDSSAKHLRELTNANANEVCAAMLCVIKRTDCNHFRLTGDIDPACTQPVAAAQRPGG
ncbi:MAG TPA: hypothetical protein DIT35_05360 [Rhodospirillaceae bacterium]|nr:hypothetical protein [Rhodospirillaceae bacterium]